MNIKALIKKVEREAKPDRFGETYVQFGRDYQNDGFGSLRRSTQIELEKMRQQLNRLIPNDFGYYVYIEEGEISGSLEYENGLDSGANMPLPADLSRNYIKELKKVDWDEYRAFSINGTEAHDEACEMAKNLPGELPSTVEARREFTIVLDEFEKAVAKEKRKFGILVYDEMEHACDAYYQTDSASLEADIERVLIGRFAIITILRDGKLLGLDEIESVKTEALNALPPISKAKALGQYELAIQMMMQ